MLNLNILPQKFKKEIKLSRIYKVIKNIILLLVFLTMITATIFLLGDLALQVYLSEDSAISILSSSSYKELDDQVKIVEEKMDYITNMQGDFISWSKLIEDIMVRTNDDIVFSKITVDKEDHQLVLVGYAKTRKNFLDLKKQFKNSPSYLDIDFPIQNILEKNDINFNMTITVDLYDFK